MALNEASQPEHSLQLNSDLSECERLYQFLADFTKQHELADDILHDLKLATEEIFANIVIHGYKKTRGHVIDISIATHPDYIDISFSDEAIAYNPLDSSSKPGNENDCCEGGMGLHIIQSATDKQSYNRIDNRNVFIITKHYTIQK